MDRKKLRVLVLFGGRSGEHEVSVQSGSAVLNALDRQKYEVIPVNIGKDGRWLKSAGAPDVLDNKDNGMPVALLGDPFIKGLVQTETFQKSAGLVDEVDLVFPVLHGTYGEDGTVQGLLEMADLPYVGGGVLASAVGMDKVIMKKVFAQEGIPQARFWHCLRSEWERKRDFVIGEVEMNFTYPFFVKPANLGSSVGISKAHDRQELIDAFDLALKFDRKAIVEEFIDGREIEVSVLGNDDPVASVPGEVFSLKEYYDYEAKYRDGLSNWKAPAEIPDETARAIQELAVAAFKSIDCAGMARVDFFIARGSGQVYVNEINTIPGFTRFSMYPKLWELSGIGFTELLDRLVDLALEKHQEKKRNQTSFGL
ncbi:MAG TPA: D-alanine--D-alanine ligase [Desulfotomaculum sp.]|nr:D-alanine--D-alanine ligase [Desulfotomaculum sp.]